jgi:hypothetical protein
MKRMAVIFLLSTALVASAQVSLGITLQNHFENYNNDTNSSSSTFDLLAGPVVRFMIADKWELDPTLGFHYIYTANKNGQNQTTGNEFGMFVGCGLFFHLFSNDYFRFSLGPDLYGDFWFTHDEYTFGIGMPINFDFLFNRAWSIRVSARAVDISYQAWKNSNNRNGRFNYNLQSILAPSFTLFYTF